MTRAEAIIEARRLRAAGEFRRQIVQRTPDDIRYDCFELVCGHHMLLMAALVRAGEEALLCHRCMEAWVEAQVNGPPPAG